MNAILNTVGDIVLYCVAEVAGVETGVILAALVETGVILAALVETGVILGALVETGVILAVHAVLDMVVFDDIVLDMLVLLKVAVCRQVIFFVEVVVSSEAIVGFVVTATVRSAVVFGLILGMLAVDVVLAITAILDDVIRFVAFVVTVMVGAVIRLLDLGTAHFGNHVFGIGILIENHHSDVEIFEIVTGTHGGRKQCQARQCQSR
jgi:hypothetical protein